MASKIFKQEKKNYEYLEQNVGWLCPAEDPY